MSKLQAEVIQLRMANDVSRPQSCSASRGLGVCCLAAVEGSIQLLRSPLCKPKHMSPSSAFGKGGVDTLHCDDTREHWMHAGG